MCLRRPSIRRVGNHFGLKDLIKSDSFLKTSFVIKIITSNMVRFDDNASESTGFHSLMDDSVYINTLACARY